MQSYRYSCNPQYFLVSNPQYFLISLEKKRISTQLVPIQFFTSRNSVTFYPTPIQGANSTKSNGRVPEDGALYAGITSQRILIKT